MIVLEGHGSGIHSQCFLDHFARVNRGTIDGAKKDLDVVDQPMLGIEKHCRENLVFETCQLGDQIFLDQLLRSESSTSLNLLIDDLANNSLT